MLKLFVKAQHLIEAMKDDESGQDLVEYGLLAALIGLACVTATKGLAGAIEGAFNSVSAAL